MELRGTQNIGHRITPLRRIMHSVVIARRAFGRITLLTVIIARACPLRGLNGKNILQSIVSVRLGEFS